MTQAKHSVSILLEASSIAPKEKSFTLENVKMQLKKIVLLAEVVLLWKTLRKTNQPFLSALPLV